MKKSLLAFALLSAFAGAASAQTNVTIYGVADAGILHTDNDASSAAKTWRLGSGLQSGSRIGFKGTEDLGGGLSAIFTLENGFNIDDGTLGQSNATTTRLFGRQAWVGLSGGFGAVKLGRTITPIKTALETIDPFGHGLAGNIGNVFDNYGERSDNTINYSTPALDGFSGQLAYTFGEQAGDTSDGRQIGLSAGYANGPVNLVLAYHDQNLLNAAGTAPNGEKHTIFLGGTYDLGVAKLHAAYARNDGDDVNGVTNIDSTDAMIGVSAPVGAGTVMASYIRRSNDLGDNLDASQLAIGYTYALSKRTNFYTSYAVIKNDSAARQSFASPYSVSGVTAGNDPSAFSVGIRHRF